MFFANGLVVVNMFVFTEGITMGVKRNTISVGYGITNALQNLAPQPIISTRNPTTADQAELGTEWVNKSTNAVFFLTSVVGGVATWSAASGGAGSFSSVTATTTVTAGTGVVAGTTVTAAGDITSTAGNITATTGNVTAGNFVMVNGVHIYAGSGVPSNGLALAVGDLYINKTAASAVTRMYIATAPGAWANITMSA